MIDRDHVRSLIANLAAESGAAIVSEANDLLGPLRDEREFALLVDLAEALKKRSDDPRIALLQAQGLIELGKPLDAIDLLDALVNKLGNNPTALIEARGLTGRAFKQIFFDARDKTSRRALDAIKQSLHHYKLAYETPPAGHVWPGLNMLAIAAFVARNQIAIDTGIDVRALARTLLDRLDETPPADRDNWYHASRAESYLGLGDLDAVEVHIGEYARSEATSAFALGGTLRQFVDLWGLDTRGEQGKGIVQALRAALARKSYGRLEFGADEVSQTLAGPKPSPEQLQKILGLDGTNTYDWMLNGLTAARSVGVISTMGGSRLGTGFLVRGGDLVPSLGNERIVVTNAHVIYKPPDKSGADGSLAPDDAKITFEAVDKNHSYTFTDVIFQCPLGLLDCALLRLSEQPAGIEPLALKLDLPVIPADKTRKQPRVYVIGYPGGRELAFSLQDNLLIDHEGEPDGRPPNPMVRRLHYRAPTEPGSSGSPVFDASRWRVIALHHAGDKEMPRLNGAAGVWPANEGIWIQSIITAVSGGH